MPRIKRWFAVSHDINGDPEFCELAEKFGATGIRVWLEILSIADRNEGEVPGDYQSTSRPLAGRCQSTSRRVLEVLQWLSSHLWIDSQSPIRVSNYAKYHISRDANKIPDGKQTASPPNLTNLTTLTYKNREEDKSSSLVLLSEKHATKRALIPVHGDWPSVDALVALYNAESADECPAVQQLSEARVKKARAYLSQFKDRDFWERVMGQIKASRFLRGLQASNGHGSFVADFDWLLTKGKDGSENVIKVHDGRYHD